MKAPLTQQEIDAAIELTENGPGDEPATENEVRVLIMLMVEDLIRAGRLIRLPNGRLAVVEDS